MTPAVHSNARLAFPWPKVGWFALLLAVVYFRILSALVGDWNTDPDMGHGFFVPFIIGYIVWQQRDELLALKLKPNWWGLLVVVLGAVQMMVATLGVELFLARTSFVITVIGSVWLLGGNLLVRRLAFPLFLLFFMVPIPAVIYNSVTLKLQLLASRLAEGALTVLDVPVLREGNVLELPNQKLSVVEACSGIRSLLSLTFLSLVYGYFMEKRMWIRVLLFLSTIPIAILANGSRVTVTGILTQVKPELAEGFFHESTGWVIFMIALGILILFHQVVIRTVRLLEPKRQ